MRHRLYALIINAEIKPSQAPLTAVLERALKACRIYLHEELAIRALQTDPLLDPKDGFYAHMALREQLIAMDAMEEDI